MAVEQLIHSVGYIGIFAIIFAESGLLIGFFLPGDSLLFAAGLLAAKGILSLWVLLPIMFVAAVLGVNAGYYLGKRFGEQMFSRHDALIFNPKYLERSKQFYAKHGGKTVLLARFTPIVRSMAPLLAGMGDMRFRRFMVFNIIGAALWVLSVTLIGYYFGNSVPGVDRYIVSFVVVVMLGSLIPPIIHVWRDELQRAALVARLHRLRARLRLRRQAK